MLSFKLRPTLLAEPLEELELQLQLL